MTPREREIANAWMCGFRGGVSDTWAEVGDDPWFRAYAAGQRAGTRALAIARARAQAYAEGSIVEREDDL